MRDLRDPQKLGEWLLNRPTEDRASVGYDTHISYAFIPDYPQDESMAKITAREYREELETAAAAGDKYAAARLKDLG